MSECGYRVECPPGAGTRAIAHLEELLTLAERAGTSVIVYTPPLSDEVASALRVHAAVGAHAALLDGRRGRGAASCPIRATRARERARLRPRRVLRRDPPERGLRREAVLRPLADGDAGPLLDRYSDQETLRALIEASRSSLLVVPGAP